MDPIKQTSGVYFRSLTVVFYGLIFGQVLFGLLSFLLMSTNKVVPEGENLKDVFIYIVPASALLGFILSNILFKNRLKLMDENSTLLMKLNCYRGALIVRYALLEGPSIFSIVVYMVTGYVVFLIISALIVIYFLTLMPGKEKAIEDLELSANDIEVIHDSSREI
jgi:hypothetical protein